MFHISSFKKRVTNVFSCNLSADEIIECLIQSKCDDTKNVASKLRFMFRSFDFNISQSYCDSNDMKIASELFQVNRPSLWIDFIKGLLPGSSLSEHKNPILMKRVDALFQIMYFIVNNGLKFSPMHVNVVQTIHNLTRSKELIEIMNSLGICIGYNKMKTIDFTLAKRIISLLGTNDRVPVKPVFTLQQPISAAMDNFDHIENTLSGKGSSHDTVLVLFQNNIQSYR